MDVFKYLDLQFHQHIDSVVEKTTNKLRLLFKTRWLFDEKTALMLYKSLIVPHFDYGSVVYEIAPEYQLKRLQIIQNAAARLILLEEPKCPVYQLHEKLNLDMLATRWAKAMVKITYNCLHDNEPTCLVEQLIPVGHEGRMTRACDSHEGRMTRACDSGMLTVPRVSSRYGQFSYSFRGPVQWNLTNVNLKAAVNKVQLKNLLRTSWHKTGVG